MAELDAEREAEFNALTEAQGRLQKLTAEQAAATIFPEPSGPLLHSPDRAEINALKAKLAKVEGQKDAAMRSNKRPNDREYSGSRFAGRGPAHAPDKSAERVERLVAVVSRKIGKSIGFGERDQGHGVDFSIVRWRGKVVRVDGGHVAVRSWLVCRKSQDGDSGVFVWEKLHILVQRKDFFGGASQLGWTTTVMLL